MLGYIKNLYRFRELLWIWTLRNIKVRYKQSLFGGLWAILQPLSLMVVFSVIFTYFVKISTDGNPYPIFAYTALLPWTFFSASIGLGVSTLVNNMNLVTKIYFPKEILPVAMVGACFIDLMVAATVFVGMMIYYKVPLKITMSLIPLILFIQILLILGLVLFVSALNVFYRDIHFVVPLGIQIWMYLTPIIYPVSSVPERFRGLYMLNPMAGVIEAYRDVILKGVWPNWIYLFIAAVISIIVFLLGYLFFKHVEWQFADII